MGGGQEFRLGRRQMSITDTRKGAQWVGYQMQCFPLKKAVVPGALVILKRNCELIKMRCRFVVHLIFGAAGARGQRSALLF